MMEIETANQSEIVDITAGVERHVQESGIANGICLVYSLHTTTALIINEADDALLNDILELMERIVPRDAGYEHDRGEGNAHAHHAKHIAAFGGFLLGQTCHTENKQDGRNDVSGANKS